MTKAGTKKKSNPKKKTTAKKTKVKAKKTSKKVVKKKNLTVREILFKKFEPAEPLNMVTLSFTDGTTLYNAGNFNHAETPARQARRVLLAKKFSPDAIKVAAKPPRKKLTAREILFKKFAPMEPQKVLSLPVKDNLAVYHAGNADQAQNVILTRTFDPAAIKIAGEAIKAVEQSSNQSDDDVAALISMPVIIAAGCLALLFGLITMASFTNNAKYYLDPTLNGMQIIKGNFTPLGKTDLIYLPGAVAPDNLQKVYNRTQAFTFIYDYHINQAKAWINQKDKSDYIKYRKMCTTALIYAVTAEQRKTAATHLNRIKY